ncbi:MAG: WYL domain-containing protein [Clostridiales bacterium]|nr:WYL domain-containing protein [Clostridiales bacterium]
MEGGKGRKSHQRIKPYLVLRYLWDNTDGKTTFAPSKTITAYLNSLDISAERRSIYRDIADINTVMYAVENDVSLDEAEEATEDMENRYIAYKKNKGFYIQDRGYDADDIRLMAECVYSAKFLEEGRAKRLVDVICGLVSLDEAENIKHDAFLTDRNKTSNKQVLNNISVINDAMRNKVPRKISFTYLTHSVNDVKIQISKRGGTRIVSPYKMLINDGNYYLLSYNSSKGAMRTYRIDRMKDVCLLDEPREGAEEFKKIDIEEYTKQTFSMYRGESCRVTIRFINRLLDTAVDRFGTKNVLYNKDGEEHFTVSAIVSVSDQFFSWLCGFGSDAVILSPSPVIEKYKLLLKQTLSMYD